MLPRTRAASQLKPTHPTRRPGSSKSRALVRSLILLDLSFIRHGDCCAHTSTLVFSTRAAAARTPPHSAPPCPFPPRFRPCQTMPLQANPHEARASPPVLRPAVRSLHDLWQQRRGALVDQPLHPRVWRKSSKPTPQEPSGFTTADVRQTRSIQLPHARIRETCLHPLHRSLVIKVQTELVLRGLQPTRTHAAAAAARSHRAQPRRAHEH
jgi:hypothetical protein